MCCCQSVTSHRPGYHHGLLTSGRGYLFDHSFGEHIDQGLRSIRQWLKNRDPLFRENNRMIKVLKGYYDRRTNPSI